MGLNLLVQFVVIRVGRLTITLRRASNQFQIDWDKQVAICPKGHQSQTWSEKVDESGQPIIDFSPVSLPCLSFPEPMYPRSNTTKRTDHSSHVKMNILLWAIAVQPKIPQNFYRFIVTGLAQKALCLKASDGQTCANLVMLVWQKPTCNIFWWLRLLIYVVSMLGWIIFL